MLSIRNMAKTTIQIDGMYIFIFSMTQKKRAFNILMYKNVTEK